MGDRVSFNCEAVVASVSATRMVVVRFAESKVTNSVERGSFDVHATLIPTQWIPKVGEWVTLKRGRAGIAYQIVEVSIQEGWVKVKDGTTWPFPSSVAPLMEQL